MGREFRHKYSMQEGGLQRQFLVFAGFWFHFSMSRGILVSFFLLFLRVTVLEFSCVSFSGVFAKCFGQVFWRAVRHSREIQDAESRRSVRREGSSLTNVQPLFFIWGGNFWSIGLWRLSQKFSPREVFSFYEGPFVGLGYFGLGTSVWVFSLGSRETAV